MSSVEVRRRRGSLLGEIGLHFDRAFLGDWQFHVCLWTAPVALAISTWIAPDWGSDHHVSVAQVLQWIVWQPLIEELLFRGVIQGQLRSRAWARRTAAGLSMANYLTTLLFVLAHLVHQPFLWAVAVALPSLVFGHFRDRHGHIYPSLILHSGYNAAYFLIGASLAGGLLYR